MSAMLLPDVSVELKSDPPMISSANPLAGCPFTETISAKPRAVVKGATVVGGSLFVFFPTSEPLQ
jgi:hypothetical protein